MGHMLVGAGLGNGLATSCETDRQRFLGRRGDPRRPAALWDGAPLPGTTGATLDPIFSLSGEVTLAPHSSVSLAYVTLAAASRDDLLALAGRYRSAAAAACAFQESELATQSWLSSQDMDAAELRTILHVLSALLYAHPHTRSAPEIIAANRLGQAGLWRFGLSGDYPLLLVEIHDSAEGELVREVLRAHRYLRNSGLMVDVVLLSLEQTDYGAELRGMLHRLVSRANYAQWLDQRGGVFILNADQLSLEERTLLRTAARVALRGERGALAAQLPGYAVPITHLPDLIPTRQVDAAEAAAPEMPLPANEALQFANGYGGFGAAGREYVIDLPAGRATPAPWANVIGYPEFGFLVTEAGSQCTWAGNSGENRLTPWTNDPVRDPTGEALYLRDEETGQIWTPTPRPAGDDQPYRVRHGAGYTIFEHHSHGLEQRLTLYASPSDPVKIVRLRVRNTRSYTRRITATQYVEWALGTLRADTAAYIIPQYDPDAGCLLAANPYSADFGMRVAFLAASRPPHGVTADRTEFLGRYGGYARPAALRRMGLEARITPGEDPCAALQLHLDLPPGETQEIHFVLGQGRDPEHALALAGRYRQPGEAETAWQRTQEFWDGLLGAIQVHTPEPALDLMLNRWLLYQALSCRIWGRSAFYQSSGAFGFRDQLQDVLAVLPVAPAIARGQLLEAARHQFEEGDVMHWWHPPAGRGVRTRISDDLLWLPYVAARYVAATGDVAILDERVPFRQAEPLTEAEEERYSQYPPAPEAHTLLEHCRRAVERAATQGPHGLPLMGTGDWNDGMNRVGEKGRGESVWLAWFQCDVLRAFAELCLLRGDVAAAERYRRRAEAYATAVERTAWDGDWYRRAYYDDGAPLGSAQNTECQIDAIAQSWAVLSGAGDATRSRQAMAAVLRKLVRPEERLILLFTHPFDRTPRDPGYIKGYLPGIRENGGQYTHAAIWTAWALAELGQGTAAGELLRLLNPVLQADTPEKAQVYRVEPYVVCADIYGVAPHLRRGGWTWYTGSAAWLYRLGIERVLGLRKRGAFLEIDPVIPAAWNGFELDYRHGQATYRLRVRNPEGCERGVRHITLDGAPLPEARIPLRDDGGEHEVEVVMGTA
jgi:cyclic beta-1,2-glucan synthetase